MFSAYNHDDNIISSVLMGIELYLLLLFVFLDFVANYIELTDTLLLTNIFPQQLCVQI